MEEYSKPAFVWGAKGLPRGSEATLRGSCRAAGGVNVVELMAAAGDALFDFGGHHSSGGFSLKHDRVHELRPRLLSAFETLGFGNSLEIKNLSLEIDATLSLSDVSEDTYSQIASLAPFGVGNPKPLFRFEHVPVKSARRFGKWNEHLELDLPRRQAGLENIKAVQFFSERREVGPPSASFLAHIERHAFGNASPAFRLRIVENEALC
jgi:single-stranded-DNA-specific exonuclease